MQKRVMFIAILLLAICNKIVADNQLTASNVSMYPGDSKEVSIELTNDETYVGFQFDLYLPDGLTVESFSGNSNRLPEGTTPQMAQQSDGSYRFVAAALGGNPIAGNDGPVLTLTVKAGDSIAANAYTGYLRNVKISKADGSGVVIAEQPFTVTIAEKPKVANVVFAQNGYIISLSTTTEGATIRYNLSNGGTGEQTYNSPLTMTGDCTITAYAMKDGFNASDTTAYTFIASDVTVATPTFNQTGNVVTITTTTENATIYYTTDGTTPTTASNAYPAGGITVTSNVTIKAIAVRDNWFNSAVAEYHVNSFKVSNVQFAQSGNMVTLSTTTANAKIFYTLSNNGGGEQEYTAPLTMTGDCTIEAWATRDGYLPSDTTSFVFHAGGVTCSNPVLARTEGTNVVTATTTTEGATIYYTADGSDPSEGSAVFPTEGLTVSRNQTIKAIALRQNYYPSQVTTFEVDWFKVANVTFAQNGYRVTLSTTTEGAIIRYNLSNGGTGEQTYNSPLTMTGDCTITAYAMKDGFNASDTTAYTFVAADVTVATPTFNQTGNVVTITTTTENATIYYTTDGTTPTTASNAYPAGGITVTSNVTIKAIAVRENWFNSAVAEYHVNSFKVADVQFAQSGNMVTLSTTTANAKIFYTLSNDGNGEQEYTAPLIMTGDCTIEAWATRDGYLPSDTTSFVFHAGGVTCSNPVLARTEGTNVVTATTTTEGATIYYTVDGSDPSEGSAVFPTEGLTVSRNQTIKAIALRQNYYPSQVTTFEVDWFKVANVAFAQNGYRVTLSTTTEGATIRYNLSNGGAGEQTYNTPLTMTGDCTITAYAMKDGFNASDTTAYTFIASDVTVATPTFNQTGNVVTITTTTENATIYYTTDGTTPTTASNAYPAGGITVTSNVTIKAIAVRDNWFNSAVAEYHVNSFKVADVQFAQSGNMVTLSTTTANAKIFYTLSNNGGGEQEYTAPLTMTGDCTIEAWATRDGYLPSDTTSFVFHAGGVTCSNPVLARTEGTNVVTATTTTEGATIYYTVDGSDPSEGSAVFPTEGLTVSRNQTIKAIALRQNYYPSQVTTFEVDWFKVANVAFAQNGYRVTLSTTTEGATIRYNLSNGGTGEQTYNTPLTMTGDCTITAYAMKDGFNASDTTAYTFIAANVTVATPTFSQAGNVVTISTATSGASIYYTTDGTTPTTASNAYPAGGITVTSNVTIKAIAVRDNWFNSAVAEYHVNSFKVSNVQFAQSGNMVTLSTTTANAKIFYTLSNDGNGEQEYNAPLTMTGDCTIEAWATRDGYLPSDTTSFVFHAGGVTCSNPVFARNGNVINISTQTDGASIYYTIDGTDPTEQSILYTEAITVDHNMTIKAIAMRDTYYPSQIETYVVDWFKVSNVEFAQNGYRVTLSTTTEGASIHYILSNSGASEQTYSAPLTLTGDCTIDAYAVREGYNNSDTTQFVFTAADVTVAAPVIASNGYKVGISTTTADAVIYYTLDGTEPTTQSSIYTDSITVDHNCTIKAIATRQNWFSSEVTTFEFEAPIEATFDNRTGVLAINGGTSLADALEAAGGAAEVSKTITSIVWNRTVALTNSDLQGLDNPNMLIYVPSESQAPANRDNVIIGNDSTGYTAKNIVLKDVTEGNGNFYCPHTFKAEMVSYTHEYRQQTEVGVSRGWETIALPFTVQTIMHETNGLIAPFGNDASNKHFWLRQLTQQGLGQATMISANMPYLISMPNNSDAYPAEFNLNGRVTFSSQDVEVPQTQLNVVETHDVNNNMVMFVPCFQSQSATEQIYALNVGEQRGQYLEGSVFEANYRNIRPFEAFTVHESNGPAPQFIPVSDMNGGLTGIGASLVNSEEVNSEKWYDLNGRRLQQKPTQKGIYILNGKKAIIK